MAAPAQIANDMAAWADWWKGRDKAVFHACDDCARVIRGAMSGERPDGRTLHRLERRLVGLLGDDRRHPEAFRRSASRAFGVVVRLRSGEAA